MAFINNNRPDSHYGLKQKSCFDVFMKVKYSNKNEIQLMNSISIFCR